MIRIAVCVVAGLAAVASADIVRLDPFLGEASESFEGSATGFITGPRSVFGGLGNVGPTGSGWTHATGSWGYQTTVRAYDGHWLLGSTSNGIEYLFNVDVFSFGGMFATNSNTPGANISFFDESGTLIGSSTLASPVGNWQWDGFASDIAIRRVVIKGNSPHADGFVMHDAMQIGGIPSPSTATLAGLGLGAIASARRRSR